ncbi:hypothetical protein H2200_011150 [Cladophialophora chaetospira]|uniref:Uncharacterized protein n=1 Tax=Cladophialophora chaetospira TaxID=386627 RepID=A0AA38X039_9EURO|nr:hypothetical protein H2200_011150 [Cladophialophora chaetospira]
MAIICLPIGGFFWIMAKLEEKLDESHRKDMAQSHKHQEADLRSILSMGRGGLRKDQIPDMSDEELRDIAIAVQQECMRRWRQDE